jgi:hypothetical protein
MELIKKQMPRDYVLIDSSDYHYGSLNCSREKIKEMIEKVATKKNYFLINKGDSIEAILPDDKRFNSCGIDVKENLLTPIQQADAVVKDFAPIKNKIIGWMSGNHEHKLLNTMDFGRYIAAQLGVPYGAYVCKFIALNQKNEIMHKMFFTHGYGNINSNAKDDIQKLANMKASLKNKLCKTGFSDCVFMSCGHNHQLLVVDPTVEDKLYLTDDGVGIKQHYHVMTDQNIPYIHPDSRWYGSSGSFLKLYTSPGTYSINYAEVFGYAPSEIGWLEVHVQDNKVVNVTKVIA